MVKPAVSKLKRIAAISPAGMVERIVRACSIPGNDEIVDVLRGAGDLRRAFLAEDVAADGGVARARHRRRLYVGAYAVFRSRRPIIAATPGSSVAIGLPSM